MKCLKNEYRIQDAAFRWLWQLKFAEHNSKAPKIQKVLDDQILQTRKNKEELVAQMNISCTQPGHDLGCCGLVCPCGCDK